MNADIYNTLREQILFLHYEPGQVLNEQVLAQDFGVSRTPLRTVLFRLEWEHLVRILPRTGILVTELELNRIMNVFEARLELEEVIGRLAAERFGEEHSDRLASLLETCSALAGQKDPRALATVDFGIKGLFNEAAGNPFLAETSDRLYALTFRLWYFTMEKMNLDEWDAEVRSVMEELTGLTGVMAKDPARLGQARREYLLQHLERIRSRFLGLSVPRTG